MVSSASWSFGEDDARQIEQLLQNFLHESGARCAMIVDRTGQLISTVGDQPEFDPIAFASLAAADFSANDQLATMLGEQEFSSLFHQGEKESMYLADVARRIILVVLFDGSATLGMIRIKVKNVVAEMAPIFGQVFDRPAAGVNEMETGWAGDAEDEIDRLFGNV